MSRWVTRIGVVAAVVLLVAGGALLRVLNSYEDPAVDPAWAVSGNRLIPKGAVTVRWTGTATLVFSDGETTWMTDGWFSRPGPLSLVAGEIEPDLVAIEKGLARNGVERAAAVFPVHSHYDHAMDAPEVCRRTGALLLGSESTAMIGRGWGLPESQIRVVADREPIRLGRFVVTPIESQHFQFPDPELRERALGDPEITEPLVPPVGAFEYKLGKAYVLHVAHPLGRFVIVGSAGFVGGDLDGFEADAIFLGTGGLGSQTPEYREDYWSEMVGHTRPEQVIPIHWDSLTGPIEGPFTGPVLAASFLSEGSDRALAFLKEKSAAHPEIRFLTLPRYDEVVLFPPREGSRALTRAAREARATAAEETSPGASAAAESRAEQAAPAARPEEAGQAQGQAQVRPRDLNRNPLGGARWTPRFPRGSRERELEGSAAQVALRRNLIAPAVLEAQVEHAVSDLHDLPASEVAKAREDATREIAADAAIGEYLSQERFGRTEQRAIDMWKTLEFSQTQSYKAEKLEEMESGGFLDVEPGEQ